MPCSSISFQSLVLDVQQSMPKLRPYHLRHDVERIVNRVFDGECSSRPILPFILENLMLHRVRNWRSSPLVLREDAHRSIISIAASGLAVIGRRTCVLTVAGLSTVGSRHGASAEHRRWRARS